jgi:hypothetical protein
MVTGTVRRRAGVAVGRRSRCLPVDRVIDDSAAAVGQRFLEHGLARHQSGPVFDLGRRSTTSVAAIYLRLLFLAPASATPVSRGVSLPVKYPGGRLSAETGRGRERNPAVNKSARLMSRADPPPKRTCDGGRQRHQRPPRCGQSWGRGAKAGRVGAPSFHSALESDLRAAVAPFAQKWRPRFDRRE